MAGTKTSGVKGNMHAVKSGRGTRRYGLLFTRLQSRVAGQAYKHALAQRLALEADFVALQDKNGEMPRDLRYAIDAVSVLTMLERVAWRTFDGIEKPTMADVAELRATVGWSISQRQTYLGRMANRKPDPKAGNGDAAPWDALAASEGPKVVEADAPAPDAAGEAVGDAGGQEG